MATPETILITGNTFPVKDQIKALGGKWDADVKGWRVPADKADEARSLVANPGAAKVQSTYKPSKCRECGVSASSLRAPYEKILRNGFCTGCWRDRRDGYGD